MIAKVLGRLRSPRLSRVSVKNTPAEQGLVHPLQAQLLRSFQDETVLEIFLHGQYSWIERYRDCSTRTLPSPFRTEIEVLDWVQKFARSQLQRLDPARPGAGGLWHLSNDLMLRWHALIPPISPEGVVAVFRRHRFESIALEHFQWPSSHDRDDCLQWLNDRRPLMIFGPTGSGKSSLLSAFLAKTAVHERIAMLESLPELPLISPSWFRLSERVANVEGIGAISLEHLVGEALRLSPDRIVVGEIRSLEARAFLLGLLSGHGGMMATIHGATAAEAWSRLCLLAGITLGELRTQCSEPIRMVGLTRGNPPRIIQIEDGP